MELPVVKAAKLIKNSGLNWIDNVYRTYIPESVVDNVTTTDVLVTEYSNDMINSANNNFKTWSFGVEIQLFYKRTLESNFDMALAELNLIKLFKKNNWFLESSKSHVVDPETKQVSRVFYFIQNQTLQEDN